MLKSFAFLNLLRFADWIILEVNASGLVKVGKAIVHVLELVSCLCRYALLHKLVCVETEKCAARLILVSEFGLIGQCSSCIQKRCIF